jgi:hypothetical protein
MKHAFNPSDEKPNRKGAKDAEGDLDVNRQVARNAKCIFKGAIHAKRIHHKEMKIDSPYPAASLRAGKDIASLR